MSKAKKATRKTKPAKESPAALRRTAAAPAKASPPASQPVKASPPKKVPGKRGPKVDVEQTLRRKREIVQGAARLFDRVGYHGVNMSMIADAAGVKKPTLYHYIKSKDEILFMLHELFLGTLRKNTDARLESGADELEILRGVVVDTFKLIHDYPGYLRAFFEHTRELGPEQRAQIRIRRDEYIALIVSVIERAMAKGLINKANASADCRTAGDRVAAARPRNWAVSGL